MLALAAVVGVAVLAFLGVTVGPLYAADRYRETRRPTDDERAALDRLRAAGGLDVDRVAVIETGDAAAAGGDATGDADRLDVEVSVRGPPTRRVLFVTDDALSGLEEAHLLGLLAAAAGRVESYYTAFRGVAVGVVLGVLAAIVATLVPFDRGFAALVAVGLVAFWAGRRVQFAADALAGDRVGAAVVADAFERAAALRGVEPETGDWRTLFEVQPPLGDRIARLRERDGGE